MKNADPLMRKSKHLSKVLRHAPGSVGLTLDKAGWVPVDALLSAMKMTREELEAVVRENNKKRFELSEDGTKIRASQGHSIDVELGYEDRAPPGWLYHGTSRPFLPSIREKGLLPMKRHDVHLSADMETAWIVARRRSDPVVLNVEAGRLHATGVKFQATTNGVWLVEAVPVAFIPGYHEPSTKFFYW